MLGRIWLAEKDLREGRLVMPDWLGMTMPAGCRLVCREGQETRPQVAAFLSWVAAQAADLAAYAYGVTFLDPAEADAGS